MMPRSHHALFVLVAFAAATACSGASTSSLLNGKGGSSSSSGGTSGSSSGSSSGVAVDSGSGSSSGAAQDSGAVDTGPLDTGAPPIDTGTGDEPVPTGPAVLCPMNGNPSNCQAGDICCVVGDATQGMQTDTCQASGQSCAGTRVRCAMTADCATGQVCCGTQQNMGGVVSYTEVACTPAASCPGMGTKRIFCDPAGNDCPTLTPTCGQSSLMPGYSVCQ